MIQAVSSEQDLKQTLKVLCARKKNNSSSKLNKIHWNRGAC